MKLKITIISLFIIAILVGCEDSSVVEVQSTDTDFIGVQAELIGGEIFEGVTIRKPLPFTQNYSAASAALTDVIAYIKVDSVQVIPLHHASDGLYKPLYDVEIKIGSTYELFARIGDRKFYSITTVPSAPVINKANIQSDNYFTVTITSKPGIVYGATWAIRLDSSYAKADDFYEIVKDNSNTFISIRTKTIPDNLIPYVSNYSRYVQVYAFDRPFLDYFNTKGNNQPIDDYFSQGGGPVSWNVYGDGVFGLFIGVAASEYVHPDLN